MRSAYLKLAPPAQKTKSFTLCSNVLECDVELRVHRLTAVDSLAIPGYADELYDQWQLKPPTITADDGSVEVLHASESTCRSLTTIKLCFIGESPDERDLLEMLRYPDLAEQIAQIYAWISTDDEGGDKDDEPKNHSIQPTPSSPSDHAEI